MSGTLEKLGFCFAWDKDGRYPIDASKPILLDENRRATVYLTHRPIQEEDGHWYWWEIYPFEREFLSSVKIGTWVYQGYSTRYAFEFYIQESREGCVVRVGQKRETMLSGKLRRLLVTSIRFAKPGCNGMTDVAPGDFAYLANNVDGIAILQESIPQTRQIGSDTFVDIDDASIDFSSGSCGGVEIDLIVTRGSSFSCEIFEIAYNDATGKIDVAVSPLVGKRVEFSTAAYIAQGDRVRCSIHWEDGLVKIVVGDEEYVETGYFSFPPHNYVEQDDAVGVSISGVHHHDYFVIYPRQIRNLKDRKVSYTSSELYSCGQDAYRQYNERIAHIYGFSKMRISYPRMAGSILSTSPSGAKISAFKDSVIAKNYIEQGIKIDIDASGSDREEVYLWATLNGALMHFAHKMRLTPKPDGDIEVELVDTRVI